MSKLAASGELIMMGRSNDFDVNADRWWLTSLFIFAPFNLVKITRKRQMKRKSFAVFSSPFTGSVWRNFERKHALWNLEESCLSVV